MAPALAPGLPIGRIPIFRSFAERLAGSHQRVPSVMGSLPNGHPEGSRGRQFAKMAAPTTRSIHSSTNRPSPPAGPLVLGGPSNGLPPDAQPPAVARRAPTSVLPLTTVLRSLATTTISSSPFLLPPSLAIMSLLANSRSPFLNPDKNP